MKHYANYRAQIRRMSDESTFTSTSAESSLDSLDSAQPVGLKPFYPAPNEDAEGAKKRNGPNPYRDYLKRRRKVVVYQVIVFVILAAIFTVWMLLLLQRS